MLFNSLQFIVFFIAILYLYFGIKHKYRWVLMLIASCYFYMVYNYVYILFLFAIIGIDYSVGLLLNNTDNHLKRKCYLIASIIANLGLLFYFKYHNFFIENIALATGKNLTGLLHNYALPIGLSFHTFQALSYTIEVYRKNFKAEKHLGYYALYVLFFPQLVAGPIERPQNILPQLHKEQLYNTQNILQGFLLIAIGLFKKIVIADRLALFTDTVFSGTESNWINLFLASFFFAVQIYCDFSGYSSIAIGTAKCFGINMMTNFNYPLQASSLADLWRKWHISLSSWFKDYLFIPLGGSRKGVVRTMVNIIIVFTLSGVWHGAGWNFFLWGFFHAIVIIFEQMVFKNFTLPKIIAQCLTLFIFVISLFVFRVDILGPAPKLLHSAIEKGVLHIETGFSFAYVFYCLILSAFIIILEPSCIKNLLVQSKKIKILSIAFMLILIVLIGVFNNKQFIYFQF